jgi:dolichol kinase
MVEKLASMVGADYAFGIDVGINDGALTGEIWGDAIEVNGKFKVLSQIVAAEGLKLEDCVVVADDRNNSCIFLSGMQKIGYNPDFVLRVKADKVVTGSLSGILPLIYGKSKQRSLPSKNAVLREIIHALGFFVPLLAGLIGIYPVALLICVVMALYFISELSRMSKKNLPIISAITRNAASQAELYEFAAAPLYFAIGILITLVLFPAPVNSAAIAIFALGDSAASLFGGLISKKPLPFNKGKTLEGSIAGFFFAFLAGSVFVSLVLALIGAAVAMMIESLPLPVNDNILIPLYTGLALMLVL